LFYAIIIFSLFTSLAGPLTFRSFARQIIINNTYSQPQYFRRNTYPFSTGHWLSNFCSSRRTTDVSPRDGQEAMPSPSIVNCSELKKFLFLSADKMHCFIDNVFSEILFNMPPLPRKYVLDPCLTYEDFG